MLNKMFNTHTNKITFNEERILYKDFHFVECTPIGTAPVDCSTAVETLRQQCESGTKQCLQRLKNKNMLPIPTNLKRPDDPPLEWFGPETLLLEAGAIKATISLITVTRITRSGEYILRIVDNGVDKAVSVSRKFYDTYLRKEIKELGKFIRRVNPNSSSRQRLNRMKAENAKRAAQLHYERYTIDGIFKRIEREGLYIKISRNTPVGGFQEYFLMGQNGALRSVQIRISKKDQSISMFMPKSLQGKGYTTALYALISDKFKLPIVMSKNLTESIFDNNGNLIKRGGKYIWEELRKIAGAYYEKGGRTYFDAN